MKESQLCFIIFQIYIAASISAHGFFESILLCVFAIVWSSRLPVAPIIVSSVISFLTHQFIALVKSVEEIIKKK